MERQERILEDGLVAMGRIKGDQHFDDWMRIKSAMEVITERACAKQGVAEWDDRDRKLIKVFGELWDEYETRLPSNHKPLSKQERSALRFLIAHPEVQSWRDTQPGEQKRKLNHPNSVINKWRGATQPKKPSTKPTMRDNLIAAEEELHRLKAHNAELEASRGNAESEESITLKRVNGALESEIEERKKEVEELRDRLTLKPATGDKVWCSFCGKSSEEVLTILTGPQQVAICNECVVECVVTIREQEDKKKLEAKASKPKKAPKAKAGAKGSKPAGKGKKRGKKQEAEQPPASA
jgi:hypothetical protein